MKKNKVCMIVQDKNVKGGIASVISGYYGSKLEEDFDLLYVESYKDGGKITKLIKAICGYIKFLKVLLINKPDIVHIHSSFGASFYRKIPFIYLANWFKRPIINHVHGADFEEFYNNANNTKKLLIKNIYNKCEIIIALSEEWKEKLNKIVVIDKIRILPNYSILQKQIKEERLKRRCNNRVLFLGEIGERKGCFDIPYVIEKVKLKIPNVKFILCGSGQIDKVKELIKQKGIEENVEFPGWVRGDKKNNLLRDSDIFFLPSYNEGMPMSILDSMGYALPIISTNVGGIPKIVNQGINGYLCDPGDVDSFAEHIIFLLDNREKLLSYGNESWNIVNEKYSLISHLNILSKLYMEVIR